MKKFLLLLLVLAMFSCAACGEAEDWEDMNMFPTTGGNGELGAIATEKLYAMSEFDPMLGPGPFSLNALAERFGEPLELSADTPLGDRAPSLMVCFEELWFLFIVDTDVPWYEVKPEQINWEQPMRVYQTMVYRGDIALPRGLRFGSSLAQVRAAYPAGPYWGSVQPEDRSELFYRYYNEADEAFARGGDVPDGEYGLYFWFEGDTMIEAKITWFDVYN